MLRPSLVSLLCKTAVVATAGLVVWYWTVPRFIDTKWNVTLASDSHDIYERALRKKFHLENELRYRRRSTRFKGFSQGEPVRGQDNIMFVETSCLVDSSASLHDVNPKLTSRQACSIEAAANLNPLSEIYLLHSCPLNYYSSEYIRQLFDYPNIRFWHIDMGRLVSGTPLEQWDYEAALKRSKWPIEHYSDVIRVIILWKYGGTYLDLDILLIRSLNHLESSFVCAETNFQIGSSVMRLNSEGIGHLLAELCILGVATDFRGDIWVHNGPEIVTRALKEICKADEVSLMSAEMCMGVAVHSSRLFFPILYWEWKMLFNSSKVESVMRIINGSAGVHMWNKLSYKKKVYTDSNQPYNLLARKFCPRVHSHSGAFF